MATDGFERIGLFVRDDGNGNFEATDLGAGNCYALTFDSHDGRVRAGVVVDGVFTDFLETAPLFLPETAWREFRIDAYGDQIQYELDGAQVAVVTDDTHASGRFGIGYHSYFNTASNRDGAWVNAARAWTIDFDYDDDGDIDITDLMVVTYCCFGPASTYSHGHLCVEMDGDGDLDIDLVDLAAFQTMFTGSSD